MDLDILSDAAREPERPRGLPCRIAVMRRDRPDLAAQWDLIAAAKRSGRSTRTGRWIGEWFSGHGFPISRSVVDTHLAAADACAWCSRGLIA